MEGRGRGLLELRHRLGGRRVRARYGLTRAGWPPPARGPEAPAVDRRRGDLRHGGGRGGSPVRRERYDRTARLPGCYGRARYAGERGEDWEAKRRAGGGRGDEHDGRSLRGRRVHGIDDSLVRLAHGAPLWTVLALALVLGIRHAADPDHLSAVTTLVAS